MILHFCEPYAKRVFRRKTPTDIRSFVLVGAAIAVVFEKRPSLYPVSFAKKGFIFRKSKAVENRCITCFKPLGFFEMGVAKVVDGCSRIVRGGTRIVRIDADKKVCQVDCYFICLRK